MKIYNAPTYTEQDLERLEESEMSFPFNDADATYNGLTHQYQLTDGYFLQRGINLQLEIDGNDPEKVQHFLEDLRVKFYTRIYTQCKSPRNVLNYIIAKRGIYGYSPYEYRQAFLEAMYLEGCYLLDNGDISRVSGVDLDTMQNMSVDVIRNQDRDFLKDSLGILSELGLNYRGSYRFRPIGQGEEW